MSVPTAHLKRLCDFVIDCPHFTPEWTLSGFLVIRNQNIRNGALDLSNPSYTHKADFDRRNRRAKPQGGDIIFTREAPMGEVCIVPKGLECCLGQRQVLLRPRQDVDRRFLFYALRAPSVRHQIFWNEGTGSTVSNVRIPVLEALQIPRLGRAEACIGALLGALDDKIDLNRRMNETLETMARAIFKDWFVDFGPTRAKTEGRPAYLTPDIWALFPERFDDEGKPEGWTKKRIAELFTVSIGRTPPRKESQHFVPGGSGKAWLSIRTMGELQTYAFESEEDITPEAAKQYRVPIVPADTVMVSFKLTVGRVAIAAHDMHTNEAIAHLVACSPARLPTEYVYCFMKAYDYSSLGTTSSIATAVNSESIRNITMLVPDMGSVNRFRQCVTHLFQRIRNNCEENRVLAATRDLLLPKLMSGEIRIREAEKIVEAAL